MLAKRALSYQIIVMVLLSFLALAINHFHYQYPGNFYLPPGWFIAGLNLLFMYAGFYLLQGHDGKITQIIKEMILFFLVMALIGLATNAAQYTPFPTIDQHILTLEARLNIDNGALIAWTYAKPLLKMILDIVYNSLDYQMCYIPLIIIAVRRTDLIREHYFLLITTALTGFTFYYFFPTTAPASVIDSQYFTEAQRATYLKFSQIHHHIQPETLEGGLIALPSFHVIWAWLCLYLLRGWPVAFLILLPVNVLLTLSCVLLGWHYVTDIAGGIVVIILSHGLYRYHLLKCK